MDEKPLKIIFYKNCDLTRIDKNRQDQTQKNESELCDHFDQR